MCKFLSAGTAQQKITEYSYDIQLVFPYKKRPVEAHDMAGFFDAHSLPPASDCVAGSAGTLGRKNNGLDIDGRNMGNRVNPLDYVGDIAVLGGWRTNHPPKQPAVNYVGGDNRWD